MSTTSFDEIHNGRQVGDSLIDGKYATTGVRVFRVVNSLVTDGKDEMTAHVNCPSIGAAHPDAGNALLRRRSFRNETFSKKVWICTCTYSSESKDGTGSDPTDLSARISWRSEQFQEVAVKRNDGWAIANSACDPFDPPPMKDDSRWMVTVQKNMLSVPTWIIDYQDAINNAPFWIDGLMVAEKQAKVQNIEISEWQYTETASYRKLTLGICIKEGTHSLSILDAGFRRVSGSNRYKIYNDDGTEPTAPVMLDGSGGVLSDPGPDTAVFMNFDVYPEKDFTLLPLV